MRPTNNTWNIIVVILLLTGCGDTFLDQKPELALIVPNSLADFQELLDNPGLNRTSALPQLSCDDYYIISEEDWFGTFTATERHAYIWHEDVFGGEIDREEWLVPYTSVLYANAILDGLRDIAVTNENLIQHNNIRGQAHFVRAWSFFDIAVNWAPPYDENTADADRGIPLKLTPNVDEIVKRSSVSETYDQIISDLKIAIPLLEPEVTSLRNRASKPAAFALLSRVYLNMRKYDLAELYVDSCLAIYGELIDYNTIDKNTSTPFDNSNDESIFYATQVGTGYNNALPELGNINIDTALLNSYENGDLRRDVYFSTHPASGLTRSKRRYAATSRNTYTGLATDEMYLIKAECAARRGDVSTGLKYLNTLLVNRFEPGTFSPYINGNSSEVLEKIIAERRKELVWRGNLRWCDLRRLNKEGAEITLVRKIGNKTYTLEPNSPRWTFNIPEDEIARSGIQQNER